MLYLRPAGVLTPEANPDDSCLPRCYHSGMNKIVNATEKDRSAILGLYRAMYGGPAGWDESYPSDETISWDLSRDSLFVMKDGDGSILAAVSIDADDIVDSFTCWDPELVPGSEVARLCVREDAQGRGISKAMMQHVFQVLRERGKKSIHLMVRPDHKVAMSCYESLGFEKRAVNNYMGHDYVCMERAL